MTRLSIKLFFSILCFALMFSCGNNSGETVPTSSPSSTNKKSNSSDKPGMYSYGDGTGGIYTITTDSILFDPVSVVLKSNDKYDSGTAVRIGLTKTQHAEIKTILDNALAEKSSHIEKRVKNSSAIALFRPGVPREKCLLAPGSGPQLDIENALKKLTGRE